MSPYKDGPAVCPKCGAPTHYTASGDTESQGYFGEHRYAPPDIMLLRKALEPFLNGDVIKYGARSRGVTGEYMGHVERARRVLEETQP